MTEYSSKSRNKNVDQKKKKKSPAAVRWSSDHTGLLSSGGELSSAQFGR